MDQDERKLGLWNKIMMNKQWINNVDVQQEEKWLADCGAKLYITNPKKYLFNKTKDRSIIVVSTGNETKPPA